MSLSGKKDSDSRVNPKRTLARRSVANALAPVVERVVG